MFNCKTKEEVLQIVKEQNVSFIQFWFTDVLGVQKVFSVTPSELKEGLEEGMGFDGSSIQGFCRIEESDMIAMPDPTTFQLISWRPSKRPVARMICDILKPDGSPMKGIPAMSSSGCSRKSRIRATSSMSARNWSSFISPATEPRNISTGVDISTASRGPGHGPAAADHLRPPGDGNPGRIFPS
jgi:glutamine synthetase